eukprot:CAMPEP_0168193986 /NCGR_PEP_ID=MMETSP0139_2-20121125/18931_1 /TAXON_ID=44445 /ORGANISM="Pseudo-nitzschia australis, Strain 10249 10 AB" /LENGTH=411 /DNA_ID=CAMNT_0008117443 /DNA_START=144 /DNA_END=1379 /DNA_ORIENTATION=+
MSDYYGPPGGGGVNASSPTGIGNNDGAGGSSHYQQQHQQQPQQLQQLQYRNANSNNRHRNNTHQNKGHNNDHAKIFVGGLSWQTTEESLRFHFEQFGPVASVDVMRDRNTGDPRGFAFVVFQDPSTIDLVMNEGKHEINHKIVDVKRAQARGQAPPSIHTGDGNGNQQQTNNDGNSAPSNLSHNNSSNPSHNKHGSSHGNSQHHNNQNQQQELTPEQLHNKVFVGGIPPNIDKDGLKEIFEEFGSVVDAIVMVDQVTNRSRCFGFVTFENGSNGAQKAIERQPLNIQGRHVEVKLATPKAEQRRMPSAAGPKHVGLRAGMSGTTHGKYAGFAVAYGRSGWKAGYGTFAFGQAGWGVKGWEDIGGIPMLERAGFSFSMLEEEHTGNEQKDLSQQQNQHLSSLPQPPSKRARY